MRTILIVDDNSEVIELAAEALMNAGYPVRQAASGAEALEILEVDASIRLLLTDVVMPEMSGPQLATRAKAGRPDLNILYISGYVQQPDWPGSAPPGKLIAKPWRSDDLVREVQAALQGGTA